jgi:hypothetical protein
MPLSFVGDYEKQGGRYGAVAGKAPKQPGLAAQLPHVTPSKGRSVRMPTSAKAALRGRTSFLSRANKQTVFDALASAGITHVSQLPLCYPDKPRLSGLEGFLTGTASPVSPSEPAQEQEANFTGKPSRHNALLPVQITVVAFS